MKCGVVWPPALHLFYFIKHQIFKMGFKKMFIFKLILGNFCCFFFFKQKKWDTSVWAPLKLNDIYRPFPHFQERP